jgi:hypothetical protein
MFSNINQDNKIKGIPHGLIVSQFERTTELDERILNRAFPSSALKPNCQAEKK